MNPLQFGDPEDFSRYPRGVESDVESARSSGATIVFAPAAAALIGDRSPAVTVDPGPLATILEGASRPGHFAGVATIVTKLFALVWPERAYFGEKDYQQLTIIRALASELSFPVDVVGCPTVREPDGLALSSRNSRLDDAGRAAAPVLYAALVAGRDALGRDATPIEAEAAMASRVAAERLVQLDYASCRDSSTLGDPRVGAPRRLLIAGVLAGTRLIDNIADDPGGPSDAVEYPAQVAHATRTDGRDQP